MSLLPQYRGRIAVYTNRLNLQTGEKISRGVIETYIYFSSDCSAPKTISKEVVN